MNRRHFLSSTAAACAGAHLTPLLAQDAAKPRFEIGIQEYTFHRWLKSGKLKHEDFPEFAKDKLGVRHIEYFSRPFAGREKDQTYVKALAKRTQDADLNNLLILVDSKNELDSPDKAKQAVSIDEHKHWVDCAATLGCSAIRVNARSGGDPDKNLQNAVDGINDVCDHAKGTGVQVVIEPHGGNSKNPDWLIKAMKTLDRPEAGLLPDFNNFGSFDRYDGVTKCLPYAAAVCAKSLAFDPEGNSKNTDFYRMLEIIHASKFSGVISIEFEGHDIDPVEGALKTKALLEKAIAKAETE